MEISIGDVRRTIFWALIVSILAATPLPLSAIDPADPELSVEALEVLDDLRQHADYLEQFAKARVPVLWRPLHEIEGGWFWWSDTKTPENTAKLWRMMFDYLVHQRKRHNLIWVYSAALKAGDHGKDVETIEWCNIWIPDANETKLPRVLLIGDSITGGYGPKVADALKGKASVARLTTSKSIGDPALLAEVALVLGQCRFDVVHFNNGLHGWGYSEEEYQQHFPALVATIRKHAAQAKLIWATITPMRQAGKLDVIAENTKRVQARNKIAQEIVTREGIAVDDLYGLVKDHAEYWSPDGVHFNAQGIAAQAEQATQQILEGLQ